MRTINKISLTNSKWIVTKIWYTRKIFFTRYTFSEIINKPFCSFSYEKTRRIKHSTVQFVQGIYVLKKFICLLFIGEISGFISKFSVDPTIRPLVKHFEAVLWLAKRNITQFALIVRENVPSLHSLRFG